MEGEHCRYHKEKKVEPPLTLCGKIKGVRTLGLLYVDDYVS
jgi:hypothetical protein